MINARDAARYVISLDAEGRYFTNELIPDGGSSLQEGNIRLNLILHLAQNIYIGRCRERLIDADFYAYDVGGIIPDIWDHYAALVKSGSKKNLKVSKEEEKFLKKVYLILKDAPIHRLIEIAKEDPAWLEKCGGWLNGELLMNQMKYANNYKYIYQAANFCIDRIHDNKTKERNDNNEQNT